MTSLWTATRMPATFSAGSTVSYRREVPAYPASAGGDLKLILGNGKTVTATVDGDVFLVELSSTDTAALAPGLYDYLERRTVDGKTHDVGSGTIEVTPDLATATEGDQEFWAETALRNVRARLAGSTDPHVRMYQIEGRGSIEFFGRDDLLKEETRLALIVDAHRRNGRPRPPTLAAFTRPGGPW